MNAIVDIKVGVQTRKRFDDEPFRPTRAWSSNWHWIDDLDHYGANTGMYALEVYNYIVGERAIISDSTTHLAIRLDNPTHPTPAKGVIPLAKAHRDTTYTDLQVVSADFLQTEMNNIIVNLKATAKY